MNNAETLEILENANEIVKNIKDSSMWYTIIEKLNEDDVDYMEWSDIDIIIWGFKNIFGKRLDKHI